MTNARCTALLSGLSCLLAVSAALAAPRGAASSAGAAPRGAASAVVAAPSAAAAASRPARVALVDLNNADLDTLLQLEGITAERASAIVRGRPYRTPDEMVSRRILSRSAFDKIKPRVVALKPAGA